MKQMHQQGVWVEGGLFSVKRRYRTCDWDRTHIAVEREHIRSGEIIVPI